MSANVVRRMPAWTSLVWVGVVGSVLAWTWAWFVGRGAAVVMVFVAIAAIVLAMRGTNGMRAALVGLIIAGVTMFLAALYAMYLVMLPAGQTSLFGVMSVSVCPLVAAMVLLLGAIPGYRHARQT